MDYQQQVGKNFLWLTIAQGGVRVLGVFFYLFLAYKLLDTGIGRYNFISSFVPFWFIIIDFGAGDYLYREWATKQQPQERIQYDFNILFTVRLVITLAVFVIFFGVNFFVNREILLPMLLFYASMFIAMFLHLYDLFLQSSNLFRFTATRQIIEKLATVIIGFVLLSMKASLTYVFVAMLAAQVISAFYYYRHVVALKLRLIFDWQRSRHLFVRGLPFMFIAIFASLYSRIDMTMLRYMKGFESVGWYGAAYKFLDISSLFSVLFTAALFPIISGLANDKLKSMEYEKFFLKALRIIFSAGVLIALAFIFLAPHFIRWFFPESFGPAALTLRILMLAQILMFVSILFNNLLIIQNKEGKGLLLIGISASLNILLNLVLIPKFSLYGAAWATVLAEMANLAMLQYAVLWHKDVGILSKMALLVAGNGVILAVVKTQGELNNLMIGAFILLANMVILWWSRLLEPSDLKMFTSPLQSKLFGITNTNP